MRVGVVACGACAVLACTRAAPMPSPTATATPATPGATAVADAAPAASPQPSAALPGTAVELGGRSKAGKYTATLRFSVPKLGELFSTNLRVTLASGAALPDGATVTVDATMPEHRHGMMTQPATTVAGPGLWRTDGMKLHMQGRWVFAVDVSSTAGDDRLELPFEQPPEATPP